MINPIRERPFAREVDDGDVVLPKEHLATVIV
jgi:hypothetical protein